MKRLVRFGNFSSFLIFCCLFCQFFALSSARAAEPVPLKWKEAARHAEEAGAKRRAWLDVVIVPDEEQRLAIQPRLAATVKQAAAQFHAESGVPVITVRLLCQYTGNEQADAPLATATYIPDCLGYDGKSALGPWDNLAAAYRGFTGVEREYLRLWAEMQDKHRKNGLLDEAALDAAISKRLGIARGTSEAHMNFMGKAR